MWLTRESELFSDLNGKKTSQHRGSSTAAWTLATDQKKKEKKTSNEQTNKQISFQIVKCRKWDST